MDFGRLVDMDFATAGSAPRPLVAEMPVNALEKQQSSLITYSSLRLLQQSPTTPSPT